MSIIIVDNNNDDFVLVAIIAVLGLKLLFHKDQQNP